MNSARIVGVRATDARPTVSESGRVCQTEGCETVLSRYNSDSVCNECGRGAPKKRLTRRTKPNSDAPSKKATD